MGKKIMIIYHGISLILLSIVLLIVGLIKPKWILFWVENPQKVSIRSIEISGRFIVTFVSMVLFMIGMVLYGNGVKAKKAFAPKQPVAAHAAPVENDKPEPTPPPAPPAPPAQAPTTSANELRP